jgi:hypothetical protein
MTDRCTNPRHQSYARYGGRGITVCTQWLGPNGFRQFATDMGDKPSPEHTLERVNNDAGYSPENCIWATWEAQAKNKRTNVSGAAYDAVVLENQQLREAVELLLEAWPAGAPKPTLGLPYRATQ